MPSEMAPSGVGADEKQVQLGLPGTWAVDCSEPSDQYTTKIGGRPDWPPSVQNSLLENGLLKCAVCGGFLGLVAQVHAPLPLHHGKQLNERTIYILGCPTAGCGIDPTCWRTIRVQKEHTIVTNAGEMNIERTNCSSLETCKETTETRVVEPSADWFQEESSWGAEPLGGEDNATEHAEEFLSMSQLAASLMEAGRLAAESGHKDSQSSRGTSVGSFMSGRGSRQGNSGKSNDAEVTDTNFTLPLLPCFYIYFQDEGCSQGKVSGSPSSCLQEVLQANTISPNEGSGANGSEVWDGEEYEPDRALHVDRTYLKFKKHLDLNAEQCFRYCFGGEVLGAVEGEIAPGNCIVCGGPRVYEMQLMPPLLYFLQQAVKDPATVSYSLEEWDWFTLIVLTCAQSCSQKADEVTPVREAMRSAARRGHASSKKRSYLLATCTGLLSSSCCLIQLLLNTFSISCAGFSILNPYRSFFVCLTAGVIAATIWEYGLFTRPTLRTLLIAGVLAASPESVKLYNEGRIDSFKWEKRSGELAVFELKMTGLSCQACANKVKLQIQRQEGVVGCDVFLEEMRAVVRSRPGTFKDDAQLEALVVAAGSNYRGTVLKQSHLSRGGGSEDQDKLEF